MSACYHLPLTLLDKVSDAALPKLLDYILDRIPKSNTVLVSVYLENWLKNQSIIFDKISKKNFKRICIIADYQLRREYHDEFINLSPDVTYFNFYTLFTKLSVINPITNWTAEKNKALLLTGRICKYTRIELLRYLYNQNLLNPKDIMWSFPAAEYQEKQLLADYGYLRFKEFLNYSIEKSFSVGEYYVSDYGLLFPNDWFNDIRNLYTETNYSIISETSSMSNFISDKTYKAMLYSHPFVVFSGAGHLETLQQLGFKTFDEYLPVKYDYISNRKERLMAITENIKEFQTVILKNKSKISHDVKFNFDHVNSLADANVELINSMCEDLNLDPSSFMKIFNIVRKETIEDFFNLPFKVESATSDNHYSSLNDWVKQYNNIRGNQWPDIQYPFDYDDLPLHIQHECKRQYNYGPFIE